MELRVLRYFLTVAMEENITHAAEILHVTQPTLSRQLAQLEADLGVTLFRRGNHRITLTEEGQLLRCRAREILELADKAEAELTHMDQVVTGTIAIGCGETGSIRYLADTMADFRKKYPRVSFEIYSAIADDVSTRMDRGLLDFGLLMEPVDISKYNFVHMPYQEQYRLLVRKDDPMAGQEAVTPEDLEGMDILMPRRLSVRNVFENWFGLIYGTLKLPATINLSLYNTIALVRAGVGKGITPLDVGFSPDLRAIPLAPELVVGSVMAWKKNQQQPRPVSLFAEFLQERAKEYTAGVSK
ncbi:MAG: LysR family transcriptional regulator [Succiniclasticum sp.]|jgi:DNA-binding transcriptional LysR family regulator|nr:LysR family transcriptional regulator [Succiniclasticum sp.]MCI6222313.1 LysR family transcriptional regulator [Selenomonadales bacterium]MDY2869708.1 LysR family transcriptional regulator [Succiniclasticum sp.]MDY6302726.1 LysR family transcriptional regulator [Succiniclasticum sp.]MDY6345581.1 LysR family transcriptional regulator [Succiniclasticum sp.]